MKLQLLSIACASVLLASCASTPTANNYNTYMNNPTAQAGAAADVNGQISNQAAWNAVKVTQMTEVRRTKTGGYATNPSEGLLTVRAVLVNTGNAPIQGNWRCRFFDSNNLPLYETQSDQPAQTDKGLGWHTMVVYPLQSKSQTSDANVINCQATTPLATNYRVEFHDTSNDITVYKR